MYVFEINKVFIADQMFLLLLSSVCYAANDKLNGGNKVLSSSPVDNPGRGDNDDFSGNVGIMSFFDGKIIFNGDEFCLLLINCLSVMMKSLIYVILITSIICGISLTFLIRIG